MMQSIVDKYIDQQPREHSSILCKKGQKLSHSPGPIKGGFSSYFATALFSPYILWKQKVPLSAAESSYVIVDSNIQRFEAEMKALTPFAEMSNDQRSKISVSLTVPGWFTGTDEFCQLGEAVAGVFGRVSLSSHPSASYTAMGYELCPTQYEAFECNGPGRLMTIDFQKNNTMTLSLEETPSSIWTQSRVTFTVSQNLNHLEAVQSINSFIESTNPDLILISGPGTMQSHLQQVVRDSKANRLLIDQSLVPTDKVATMGAAQLAKDYLERQFDSCFELEICEAIRRDADRIAGKFRPPTSPKRWPLAAIRNWHDEL